MRLLMALIIIGAVVALFHGTTGPPAKDGQRQPYMPAPGSLKPNPAAGTLHGGVQA